MIANYRLDGKVGLYLAARMSPQLSRFIDAARWIAAFAVLLTHVNANCLVILAEIPQAQRGLASYALWFFYGFAHQAVVVFFVLSGFLVGGNVFKSAKAGQRYLSKYIIDRTIRIYVVLVPVLILTAILDSCGRSWFADTEVYRLPIFVGGSNVETFIGNLLNFQDIVIPYFGTNSALWTLAHEYWYYLTFGLLAMPLGHAYSVRARRLCFIMGAMVLIALSVSGSYHFFGFLLWLLGAVAASAKRPLLASKRLALFVFLIVTVGLRLTVRYATLEIWWVGGLADAATALVFANLLLTLRFASGPSWAFCRWPIHKALSNFSYSLYALHMPIIVFLCAASQHFLGYGFRSVPSTPSRWAVAAIVLSAAALIAYRFSLVTEAKTAAFRRIVESAFANEKRSVSLT